MSELMNKQEFDKMKSNLNTLTSLARVDELEKIKADVEGITFEVPYENQAFDYGMKLVKWCDIVALLDKRMSELKKENK